MRIIKLATETASGGQIPANKREFDALKRMFHVMDQEFEGSLTTKPSSGKFTDWAFEYRDEADPQGTSYINISFNEWDGWFIVDKYYESEIMQNEYGHSEKIIPNFDDIPGTIQRIKEVIDRINRRV